MSPMCNQLNLNSISNISPILRSSVGNNPVNIHNVEIHEEKCKDAEVVVEKQNEAEVANVYLEKTDLNDSAQKLNESGNRVSDANEIFSNSEADVINESDKPVILSQSLRYKLTQKTKSLAKDHFTICSADFADETDTRLEKLTKNTPKVDSRILRSKFADKSKNNPRISTDFENEIPSSLKLDENSQLETDKNKSKVASKTHESKPAENPQNFSKQDHVSLCTMDFQDKIDSKIEKSVRNDDLPTDKKNSEVTSKTLRSKLLEKTQNSSKKDQVTLCTADFQDNIEPCVEKSDQTNEEKNKIDSSKKASIRVLRSNVSKKTQSILKDQVSICTLDFESKIDSRLEKSSEEAKIRKSPANKENMQNLESFQVSDQAFEEAAQVVENKEHSFALPTHLPSRKTNEELKRVSEGGNYSKSPSLFSDSSFLDGQMCSILEKNIIEGSCLADFEKSDFTQNRESFRRTTRSGGKVSENPENLKSSTPTPAQAVEKNVEKPEMSVVNKPAEPTQSISRMTWAEDSWEQTKNVLPKEPEEKKSSESPSLVTFRRTRTRLRPLATDRSVLSDLQATTSKEKTLNSPLPNTPKSILRKRVFDKKASKDGSPIAAFRTYNVSKPIMPSSPRY